jgi:hypothetical protein
MIQSSGCPPWPPDQPGHAAVITPLGYENLEYSINNKKRTAIEQLLFEASDKSFFA